MKRGDRKKPQKPKTLLLEEITRSTEGLGLPAFAYKPPDFSNEEAIDIIRCLPDYVMQHEHEILFESPDGSDQQFINTARCNYQAKADWLEFYLLNRTQELPKLQKEICHYKPLATESLAIRRLIQEVFAFCPWINSGQLCVNRWWIACEWKVCDNLLASSGFLSDPIILGKREAYEALLHENKLQPDIVKEFFSLPPLEALEGISSFIAKRQENYGFRASWDKYKKDIKSAYRLLRDSPLNPAYLVNGRYTTLSRGNAGRKRL